MTSAGTGNGRRRYSFKTSTANKRIKHKNQAEEIKEEKRIDISMYFNVLIFVIFPLLSFSKKKKNGIKIKILNFP